MVNSIYVGTLYKRLTNRFMFGALATPQTNKMSLFLTAKLPGSKTPMSRLNLPQPENTADINRSTVVERHWIHVSDDILDSYKTKSRTRKKRLPDHLLAKHICLSFQELVCTKKYYGRCS